LPRSLNPFGGAEILPKSRRHQERERRIFVVVAHHPCGTHKITFEFATPTTSYPYTGPSNHGSVPVLSIRLVSYRAPFEHSDVSDRIGERSLICVAREPVAGNNEMTDQPVRLNVSDAVATITLDRPEVLNALNLSMTEALAGAIQVCKDDDRIRAVIITGAGRGFCAGGDMKAAWQHIQAGGDPRHFFRDLTVPLHRAITDIRSMEKPVVAAVNGPAGGAGMSLAVACDFRIAAESAKFKQAYTSIGLVPDGGWTVFVPSIVGAAKATELLLLDPVLGAKEALALGFVHEVVPDDKLHERAVEVSTRLAQAPTTALGGAKALVNSALFPTLETQLERERQRLVAQGGTKDFLERLSAFRQRKQPSLPKRS